MSTTTDSKQRRSKSSRIKGVGLKLGLQIQTEQSHQESTVPLNANKSPLSPVEQLRIHTEQEKTEKEMVVKSLFKINRRPRFDSSEDDDNEMGSDTKASPFDSDIDEDGDNDADSNQHEPNKPDPDQIHNLMIPEMTKSQETDSFNYSLSLSEYDDDGNHGTNEPQPARDRSGTLKRQRARLDLLSVVIFDEVEDRDGDEHHPQCPDIHDDSNSNEGGKGNWYQRVSTLYNLPSTKQDDEPNAHFSIYGAMVRHQTVNNLKV